MGLLRRFDIASEQNDTRRLQLLQHGIEAGRNRRSIKAHDNELADLLAEGLVHEQMIVKQLGVAAQTADGGIAKPGTSWRPQAAG